MEEIFKSLKTGLLSGQGVQATLTNGIPEHKMPSLSK
jgi:hypothetical protein